jgi:hypothetical protein
MNILHYLTAGLALVSLLLTSCATSGYTPAQTVRSVISANTTDKQRQEMQSAWAAAIELVRRAKVDVATNGPASKAKMNAVFKDDSASTRDELLSVLCSMESDGRNGSYKLTYVPKFPEKVVRHFTKGTGEKIVAIAAMDGAKEIWIGSPFFTLSPTKQENTFIHELSHRAADTEDHAYLRGNTYMMGPTSVKPSLAQLLNNADTIAKFVSLYR